MRFDPGYLRHVVERLESFRSHPLGFRVAGTPEERKATKFIASEMRKLSLEDVVEEPVVEPSLETIPGYDEEARIQYTGGLSEDTGEGSLAEYSAG